MSRQEHKAPKTTHTQEIIRVELAESPPWATSRAITEKTLSDALAIERPVKIEINGQTAAILMALPGGEEELAAGFALSEGLIRKKSDIASTLIHDSESDSIHAPIQVELTLRQPSGTPSKPLVKHSSGAFSESYLPTAGEPLTCNLQLPSARLWEMLEVFSASQPIFRRTGFTHAGGLFTSGGELLIIREDVGRHNAIDKLLGKALLEEIGFEDKVLITSGRASGEIVRKVLRANVPFLLSVSAPTSLAVEWARGGGLTLIGFLRPRRFNIYSVAERILR